MVRQVLKMFLDVGCQAQYAMDKLLADLSDDAVGVITRSMPKLIGNATKAIDKLVGMVEKAVLMVDGRVVQKAREGFDKLVIGVNFVSDVADNVLTVVTSVTSMTQGAINAAITVFANVIDEERLAALMLAAGPSAVLGWEAAIAQMSDGYNDAADASAALADNYETASDAASSALNSSGVSLSISLSSSSSNSSSGNSSAFMTSAAAVVKNLTAMVSGLVERLQLAAESASARIFKFLASGDLGGALGVIMESFMERFAKMFWAPSALYKMVTGDNDGAKEIVASANDTSAGSIFDALSLPDLSGLGAAAEMLAFKVAGNRTGLVSILKALTLLAVPTVRTKYT